MSYHLVFQHSDQYTYFSKKCKTIPYISLLEVQERGGFQSDTHVHCQIVVTSKEYYSC